MFCELSLCRTELIKLLPSRLGFHLHQFCELVASTDQKTLAGGNAEAQLLLVELVLAYVSLNCIELQRITLFKVLSY